MKARIENGQIRIYHQLPVDFGHILNFNMADSQVHRDHGFFEVVLPEYDTDYHRLGNIFFDQERQEFTYPLVEIPIEQVRQKLLNDFESAKDRTRKVMLEALLHVIVEILREDMPEGLTQLWDELLDENQRVLSAINDLAENDPDSLRRFKIRSEDVDGYIARIKSFKV